MLRDEWGWDGYVQSDFWSCRSAAGSLNAGMDHEMPDAKWLNETNVQNALHDTSLEIETVDRALVRRCFAPAGVPGSTWRIGWDGPAPVVPGATTPSSQVGDRVARSAAMHLGFTGCSWVIDPPRGRVIALLTNRVHPTRETQIYREHRPRIHDAVIAALDGG